MSDGADVTWRGRSFQSVAQETGNARLLTAKRRTGGTSRCEVEDCSRRLDVMSETRVKHDCRQDGEVPWMDRYVIIAKFKVDTFWDAQPVKADERWGDVL